MERIQVDVAGDVELLGHTEKFYRIPNSELLVAKRSTNGKINLEYCFYI